MFTEKQTEELEKSMKNGFDEMKEGLQKRSEEDFEVMKANLQVTKKELNKLIDEELKTTMKAMKNDFEGLKKEMKEDMEKFTEKQLKTFTKTMKSDFEGLKKIMEGLQNHDHYLKKIQFLEKENDRLKRQKPKQLNEVLIILTLSVGNTRKLIK